MFLRTSPIYRISSDKVFWKSYQLFKDMFFWFIYYTQKGPRFSDTLMISNAVLLIFFLAFLFMTPFYSRNDSLNIQINEI